MEPENTETLASPCALVVAATSALEPLVFKPTPPGLTSNVNLTATFDNGVEPAKALNFTSDCSSAPEPATNICAGAADAKVIAFAIGAVTVIVVELELAPALAADTVTGPLHSNPSALTAVYTADATPLPSVARLTLPPTPLMRPQDTVKLMLIGTPVDAAPPISAVTFTDVLPPEGRFELPTVNAERLRLLAETAKSAWPCTVAVPTTAVAATVAAPSAETEDGAMLTLATPAASVNADSGDKVAIDAPFRLNVTRRFATAVPAASRTVALAAKPLPTPIVFTLALLELKIVTTKVGEAVDDELPPGTELLPAPPGLPPPPPHAASSEARVIVKTDNK